MAATYDGLVIALVVWAIVIGAGALGFAGAPPIAPWIAIVTLLTLGISIAACWGEASRYIDFQIEELVASVATSFENSETGDMTG